MPVGEFARHGSAVFDLLAGQQTRHFARVRGEQARTLGLVEMLQSGVGDDGQGIGIDHRRTRRFAHDAQSPRFGAGAQSRTDADGVDRQGENIRELFERTHHHFGHDRGGEQFVGVGQGAERDESGPAAHRTCGGEIRRAKRAARSGEDDDPTAQAFVRVERTRRPMAPQGGGGEHFGSAVFFGHEIGDFQNSEPSHEIGRRIGHQSGFGKTDRGGEVGCHAGIAGCAGVRVEARREIDRHGVRPGLAAQGVHLGGQRGQRFAQGTARAETD